MQQVHFGLIFLSQQQTVRAREFRIGGKYEGFVENAEKGWGKVTAANSLQCPPPLSFPAYARGSRALPGS